MWQNTFGLADQRRSKSEIVEALVVPLVIVMHHKSLDPRLQVTRRKVVPKQMENVWPCLRGN